MSNTTSDCVEASLEQVRGTQGINPSLNEGDQLCCWWFKDGSSQHVPYVILPSSTQKYLITKDLRLWLVFTSGKPKQSCTEDILMKYRNAIWLYDLYWLIICTERLSILETRLGEVIWIALAPSFKKKYSKTLHRKLSSLVFDNKSFNIGNIYNFKNAKITLTIKTILNYFS